MACSDYSSLMCQGWAGSCYTMNGVTKCPEIKGDDVCRLYDVNTRCVGLVDRVGLANNAPSCAVGMDAVLHSGHTLSGTTVSVPGGSSYSISSKIPPYSACDFNRQENINSDVTRCCKVIPSP